MSHVSNAVAALLSSMCNTNSPKLADARGSVRGRTRIELTPKQTADLKTELSQVAPKRQRIAYERYGGWLKEFIERKWPVTARNTCAFKRQRHLCYKTLQSLAVEVDSASKQSDNSNNSDPLSGYFEVVVESGKLSIRGSARKTAKHGKPPSHRKRKGGAGRARLCPEIGEELWQWFVNNIRHIKARIGNPILLSKAMAIRTIIENELERMVRDSEITADRVPKLPKISSTWVAEWRRRYRVSHKRISIAYKVSRPVLLKRLGVFWRNNIRIRYFHSKMFPNATLNFRSYDQKPLYFNTAGNLGTLAGMDEHEVEVNENCHATRQRFTVMTKSVSKDPDETMADVAARSHNSGNPESIAVLFKASGSGERILADLKVPENVKVQFGPKGSYRTEHVLEWLKHDLGKADGSGNLEVVYLDWFSAHLASEVQEFIISQGHVPLFIPGGATPWVATLDTHCHAPYQREYMRQEVQDGCAELVAGSIMPSTSRQSVLNRASDSWKCVDHKTISERAWIHDGVLLSLNEQQRPNKNDLRRQCRYLWDELYMDDTHKRIKAEIDVGIEVGDLTQWSQWPDLLEKYDNHRGLIEGEDTVRERMGDPDDDSDNGESVNEEDDDDDEADDTDGGEDDDPYQPDHCSAGSEFPTYSEGGSSAASSGASSGGSSCALSSNSTLHPGDQPSEASADLEDETNRAISTVASLMELATERGLKDPQLTKLLSSKLRELQKRKQDSLLPANLQRMLKQSRETEKATLDQARQQNRAQQQAEKTQKKALQLAKMNVEEAKHKSKAESQAAKVQLAKITAEKQSAQAKQALEKERIRLIRTHFAVQVSDRLLKYVFFGKEKNKDNLDKLWGIFKKRIEDRHKRRNYPLPQELVSGARNSFALSWLNLVFPFTNKS